MTEWLKHNWRLKLVALFLAALIWFFVNGLTNDRRVLQAIPLEVRTRPGVTLLQQTPLMVDVVVRGTREDMRQVSRDDLTVVLDLAREEKTGEFTRRLGPGAVRHPRWVQPVEVVPARATVVVDEILERDLPVEPQVIGQPANGLTVEQVRVSPTTIRVVGPQWRLAELNGIQTLPVDVSGRTEDFHQRIELNPDGLADVSLQRRWVDIEVRIRPVRPSGETP